MQLWCRKCETPITAENVDVERLIARCHKCDTLFSFADSIEKPLGKRAKRQLRFMPQGVEIGLIEDGVRLIVPWYHSHVLTMTYLAVLLVAFMLLSSSAPLPGGIAYLGAPIAVWLLYKVLTGFLNKTQIEVNAQALTISHGPIPYPGRRLRHDQIKQLYCKQKMIHSDIWLLLSYELHAILHNGRDLALITGVENCDYVLYVEQEIERHLMIKDRRIRGQIRPD